MSLATTPYPTQLEFHGELRIARWRPLVHWLLAIPHLMVVYVLSMVRGVLTFIAFFTVLFRIYCRFRGWSCWPWGSSRVAVLFPRRVVRGRLWPAVAAVKPPAWRLAVKVGSR